MKKATQLAAIETQAAETETSATPLAGNDANIGTVTVLEAFQAANVAVTEKAKASATLQQDIRQKLAEASDLLNAGNDKRKEALLLTGTAGYSLYTGRVDGLFSNEQVNSLLGDQFGYKVKQDGTASKTPNGEGEAIRKRVMRMTQAHDYVVSNEATRFFEPLDKEAVSDVLQRMADGGSIYSAYDALGELAKKARDTVPTAFNPVAILKLVDTLTTRPIAAVEYFTGDSGPALITAYQALNDAVQVILSAPVDSELPIG